MFSISKSKTVPRKVSPPDIYAWSNFMKDDPLCRVYLAPTEYGPDLIVMRMTDGRKFRFPLPAEIHRSHLTRIKKAKKKNETQPT